MPAYKDDKTKKWYVQFYYEDFTGKNVKKKKRGFRTKREAEDWEDEFKRRAKGNVDMTFQSLWQEYKEDLQHNLKESTWMTKITIVDKMILPYFADTKISDIDERMVRKWQSAIMGKTNKNGKSYSETYLRTINNQLSAILNHAVVYYKLPYNPVHRTGAIGSKHADERQYWTLQEFRQAMEFLDDNLPFKLAYYILFYTGMREGELLALSLDDFNLDDCTVNIRSNWGVRKNRNAITTTKSRSSNRVITFPSLIKPMLLEYVDMQYGYKSSMRLFYQLNKYTLNSYLKKAAKYADIKTITVHELRHSHASLLINNDVNIKALQQRLGHKNIDTTLGTYSHMYPSKQREIADMLNNLEPK